MNRCAVMISIPSSLDSANAFKIVTRWDLNNTIYCQC